jgi:hypothetical protein
MKEEEINLKMLKTLLEYIHNAKDLLERQFVLQVCQRDIQEYVLSMERNGLFDNWWTEKELQKEAKKFLKDPKKTAVSTLKQEFYVVHENEVYTIFFHLRCLAEHYYKSIRKNKMSYLVNNSKLVFLKIEKDVRDKENPVIIYEQGSDAPIGELTTIHHKDTEVIGYA